MTPDYPPLSAPLQCLEEAERLFWGSAAERAALFRLSAEGGTAAILRVDAAVVAGLAALGLPRGPVRGVAVESAPGMLAGWKDPACTVHLSAEALSAYLQDGLPDAIARIWVHESLHARQPYAPTYHSEYAAAAGYEEGMVEGLARSVLRDHAGMSALAGTFEYYVTVYLALGDVLDVAVERLWRSLWQAPAGQVRARFPRVLADLTGWPDGRPVDSVTLGRLQAVADRLFDTRRGRWWPDPMELARTWRLAIR
jgi:hypothetical protein